MLFKVAGRRVGRVEIYWTIMTCAIVSVGRHEQGAIFVSVGNESRAMYLVDRSIVSNARPPASPLVDPPAFPHSQRPAAQPPNRPPVYRPPAPCSPARLTARPFALKPVGPPAYPPAYRSPAYPPAYRSPAFRPTAARFQISARTSVRTHGVLTAGR